MRTLLTGTTLVALTLLTSCSTNSSAPSNANFAPLARPNAGVARLPSAPKAGPAYAGAHDLYVADYARGAIDVFRNKGYTFVNRITAGVRLPQAVSLDREGNLYVANGDPSDIAEFAPGGLSPIFEYTAGMQLPVDLTVDRSGNVFEADYGSFKTGAGGFVNEYAQQTDALLQSCSLPGRVEGVAVDAAGDVFASYNGHGTGGHFVEFKGGLSGCNATELHVQAFAAGGIALDKDANLIVVDQLARRVKVFPPPYRHDKRRLGANYKNPFHVKLNRRNTLLFVTDTNGESVEVIDYATGRIVKRLDSYNGISLPFGAVDGPNAVY